MRLGDDIVEGPVYVTQQKRGQISPLRRIGATIAQRGLDEQDEEPRMATEPVRAGFVAEARDLREDRSEIGGDPILHPPGDGRDFGLAIGRSRDSRADHFQPRFQAHQR